MPAYDRLPKTHLKKPDQFISFFDRLYHKAYENGFKIIIVLSISALVGVGVLFWRQLHNSQTEKIANQLYEASQKSDEEQQKILNHIRKKFPYKTSGILASLEIANLQAKKEECDKILEELNPYIGYGENKVLRSLIYQQVDSCLEIKKDFLKAEEVARQAASDPKNILKDWSALRLAYFYKSAHKDNEAKKILQELIQEGSTASEPVKDQARMLLILSFSSSTPLS